MIVVIEGIDGSGKGTQAAALQRITEKSKVISFPRYTEFYGRRVGEYLNGKYGQLDQVHPLLASMLYAADRRQYFEKQYFADQRENDVLIYDRYVPSNVAHQGAKLEGTEMTDLIEFMETHEYEHNKVPYSGLTIYLDMPVNHAVELIAKKAQRNYTDKKADIHEADVGYLERVKTIYDYLCEKGEGWVRIPCSDEDGIRPEVDIAYDVADAVSQYVTEEGYYHIKVDKRKLYAKDTGSQPGG